MSDRSDMLFKSTCESHEYCSLRRSDMFIASGRLLSALRRSAMCRLAKDSLLIPRKAARIWYSNRHMALLRSALSNVMLAINMSLLRSESDIHDKLKHIGQQKP
jgi:hypothetical protein